ncbi:phage holin family protein [Agromyces aerolatus]|uniref:phage holin family protein n=1 Tax=Agromyces sp. LY-1074 TaxID=3074080 RepID=UPI00285A6FE4|nr:MULTISPECIES: phage holin family protein [unclassified Agromyces]MDR5701630.1 phage holin family protein [Agromyces sp. LY-1074]MDR5707930.1 phage holin family protein [Agromyces sp. LY-1358]
MADPTNDERSLFTLIGELPDRVSTLVKAEIDQIKAEISYKVKHFGIGAGLIAAAAFVGVFLLGTLIATGILALSLVMPGWAAALTVSGVLLLIIAIMVGIAILNFKRGAAPLESIDSLRKDLDVVKGTGDYDRD